MTIIEVKWSGPFDLKTIQTLHSSEDFGVYQIYGTHNISGPKTLLYIGQANEQRFGGRIPQHEWLDWDFPDFEIYVGRLGGDEQYDFDMWARQIHIVEKILIDHCQPPYNSKLLQGLDNSIDNQTLIINFGKRYKLPFEISTIWRQTKHNLGLWKPYTNAPK